MAFFDALRRGRDATQAGQPTAAPATPEGMTPQPAPAQWGGFTGQNVFENWDLNPLSQQTGIPRDDLSLQRDEFLRPIESSYRAQSQMPVDATSQNLYNSPDFRAFAQSGQMPQQGGQTLGSLGGPGGASQQYGFGSAVSPWTQQFNAPTAEQAIQTPGLQYALDRAKQAIERSAAAKGTLLTGGTLRDLSENQIGMALQGYGQAYDRSRSEYDLSKSNFQENQDRPFNKYTTLAQLGRPV